MKGGRTQRVEGTYYGRSLVFKLTKVQVEPTVSSERVDALEVTSYVSQHARKE